MDLSLDKAREEPEKLFGNPKDNQPLEMKAAKSRGLELPHILAGHSPDREKLTGIMNSFTSF